MSKNYEDISNYTIQINPTNWYKLFNKLYTIPTNIENLTINFTSNITDDLLYDIQITNEIFDQLDKRIYLNK